MTDKKYADFSWDFRTSNTKMFTHCYHAYPAMMIPQVAGRIIDKYGDKAELLFDPYCGTGTSLVEANLRNINSVGTDLNPLARLITTAKTFTPSIQELDLYLNCFNNHILFRLGMRDNDSIIPPNFKNIDFWFTKDVQQKLSIIKMFIDKIEEQSIKIFFEVAFSEVVRESSLTRNSEFKLFKMPVSQIAKFNPDVFAIMRTKLNRNKAGLTEYLKERINNPVTMVCDFNTVESVPFEFIENNSVDIVVTSPPYGDSRTTVAYGQFSRLANQWLGVDNAQSIDNELMGGKSNNSDFVFSSKILNETLDKISGKDPKRAKEVYSFYVDYNKSINNVSKVVKGGGYACYVVGNRRVKGTTLPTDEITIDMFCENGFDYIETIIRNIPNKRMPSKNSPSNVPGVLDTTMKNEYIVILKKIA